MIGVVASGEEHDVVREFFELFKTPWEFCRDDGRYEVLIRANDAVDHQSAQLVIVYGSQPTAFDQETKSFHGRQRHDATLSWNGDRIPVYGRCVTFPSDGRSPHLVLEDTREPVVSVTRAHGSTFVRVGYDLFREIRFLLSTGQPPIHAGIPTLERHIAFLRDVIVSAGIPLVEIPPIPEGYRFIACLTHDIDHPSIRLHRFDHTMFGFLHRAVVRSLINVCRGRTPRTTLWRNWAAALMLPFVHLGLAKDFWSQFNRYLEIEKGLGSTFFVIPVKHDPGRTVDGPAPMMRASSYGVSDIADHLRPLRAAGCEVALHGIDAWLDSSKGMEERERVSRVTGACTAGVRMHWLFFDERAPGRLDEAGFTYDSTYGYNETVGFRAGTMQAFKPMSAGRLLELPLTIMDTALFYPSHRNLTQKAARQLVWQLMDDAERYGGALVINWHDRSLAPERLWGDFYVQLVDELKGRGAWCPTVTQAASWFQRRRSAVFHSVHQEGNSVRVEVSAGPQPDLPGLMVRVHTPRPPDGDRGSASDVTPLQYILISPARNEEAFIEKTIQSVVSQTVRPVRWVIVNDGSTDGTARIIGRYTALHDWIEVVNMPERRDRSFAAKVHSFRAGYEKVKALDHQVVGNLDADVSFDEDFLEFLLGRFKDDPALGVAGTIFREAGGYSSETDSFEGQTHVSGQCQLFRRECFEAIGGYVPHKAGGIDWIAVTTARMIGWKTRSFREKSFFHHRSLGTAERNRLASAFSYGEKDYYLGGHPLWELFRVAYRMSKRPYVVEGLAVGFGYLWASVRRIHRPVSPELMRFHRKEQMRKLRTILRSALTFKRIDNFQVLSS